MTDSFNTEGLEFRYIPSRSDDPLVRPRIFLQNGEIYFTDFDVDNPVPLSELENPYKRIRFVNGELRFFDRDLVNFVTLTDIVESNDSEIRTNSLINSKNDIIEESVDVLELLRKFYFEGNTTFELDVSGVGSLVIDVSGNIFTQGVSGISGAAPLVAISGSATLPIIEDLQSGKNCFVDHWENTYLRFSGQTIEDTFLQNYTYGLCIATSLETEDLDTFFPVKKVRAYFDCVMGSWVGAEEIEDLGCRDINDEDDEFNTWTSPILTPDVSGATSGSFCIWQSDILITGDVSCSTLSVGKEIKYNYQDIPFPDVDCRSFCTDTPTDTGTAVTTVGTQFNGFDNVDVERVEADLINDYLSSINYKLFTNLDTFRNNEGCTLQDKSVFINNDLIDFTAGSNVPLNLGGQPTSILINYLYENLDSFSGIQEFFRKVFGSKVPEGITRYGNFGYKENGYTTIQEISGGTYPYDPEEHKEPTDNPYIFGDPVAISGAGVFSDKSDRLLCIQEAIIRDISKSVSFVIDDYFVTSFLDELTAVGLVSDDTFVTSDTIIDFNTLLSTIDSDIQSDSVLHDNIKTAIRGIFVDSPYVDFERFDPFKELSLGGWNRVSDIVPVDFSKTESFLELSETDFYIVSPALSNETSISLLASFNFRIDTSVAFLFEFILEDFLTGEQLDSLFVNSPVGLGQRSYPIMLTYTGPVPKFACNQELLCSDNEFIESHVIDVVDCIVSNQSQCVGQDLNVDDDQFKFQVSKFFGDLDTIVQDKINEGETLINVPRIFKVKLKTYAPKLCSHIIEKQVSDITVNPSEDGNMNLNSYSVGFSTNQRIVDQGNVDFDDETQKLIGFNVPFNNDLYSISLICDQNVNLWYENKTRDGFIIKSERKLTGQVSWIASFQPNTENEEFRNQLPTCLVRSGNSLDIYKAEGFTV